MKGGHSSAKIARRTGSTVTDQEQGQGDDRAGASNGRFAPLRALASIAQDSPIELRLLGRALLHAAAVGVAAGFIGAAFFAGLEIAQRFLLGALAGFEPLRARGETFLGPGPERTLNPFVLALLPALGALGSGILTTWLAPETSGGGGDAAIEAYHHGGVIRRRVIPVKALAATLTLSTGGAGGREGPTMQIGAAIGAAVGRILPTRRSERRVLLVAGIAAGIAAVFRTPLGAALLATEMLYRDDFEADALVPAIFASVVSYSIVIALYGESTLFGSLPRFPFVPRHLALYVVLALVVSLFAVAFVRTLRAVQRASKELPVPPWARPAVGGLGMGLIGTAVVLWLRLAHGAATGFGVFGGGYGALQAAMTGTDWMPQGGGAVLLFAGVAVAKIAAASLTIGTGAAAGDFAPSLTIGGLVGAAFGYAAKAVLGDPTIQPAAFVLVGMGTFYGGLAHTPLSALVLVAELAGSYDLLVPMMLAIGIAYVALRRVSLYPAQVPTRSASPAHGEPPPAAPILAQVASRPVRELLVPSAIGAILEGAPLSAVIDAARTAGDQRVVALAGSSGFTGLVELSTVEATPEAERHWMKAHDARLPFVSVPEDASWAAVAEVLERCGLSQVPVLSGGEIVGWVGDRELRRAVLDRR